MFNTTQLKVGGNSQTVQFNTPSSGLLQKSHSKSRFIRFQRGSRMEGEIFPSDRSKEAKIRTEKKEYTYATFEDHPITVLQIMVFGEDHYLCEIVENKFLQEE